jgi:hypothetical protein
LHGPLEAGQRCVGLPLVEQEVAACVVRFGQLRRPTQRLCAARQGFVQPA